jgi:hypothetical protein
MDRIKSLIWIRVKLRSRNGTLIKVGNLWPYAVDYILIIRVHFAQNALKHCSRRHQHVALRDFSLVFPNFLLSLRRSSSPCLHSRSEDAALASPRDKSRGFARAVCTRTYRLPPCNRRRLARENPSAGDHRLGKRAQNGTYRYHIDG